MKVEELEVEIKMHRDLYYNGTPQISDEEFDDLERQLKLADPDSYVLKEIGAIVKAEKVKLPFFMGSLDKIKKADLDEDEKLFGKTFKNYGDVVISLKLDGLSCCIQYKKGFPVKAMTRGDGEYGFDITDKVKQFAPNQEAALDGWFRGEIIAVGEKFKELGYNTRRNFASGVINRDTISNVEHLRLIMFEIISAPNASKASTEHERCTVLSQVFGPQNVVNHVHYETMPDVESISKLYEMSQVELGIAGIDIDGMVITRNRSSRSTAAANPRWKIAFKQNKAAVNVICQGIEMNTSRNGRVVPTVLIDKTVIDGVEISRVTGHNYANIVKLGINKGAIVQIVRSGEVIPYITGVFSKSEQKIDLWNCPSCGHPLRIEGVDLVCEYNLCSAQVVKRIYHFFSMLDVKGIAEKSLGRVIDFYGNDSITSCFDFSVEDIKKVGGFQQKSAYKFVFEIQKSIKEVEDYKFLAALGISGLGRTMSKSLLKRYEIDEIFLNELTIAELSEIEGIAKKTAQNIVTGIKGFRLLFMNLIDRGMTFKENEVTDNSLEGMTFVITGKLSASRNEIEARLLAKGGSVSKTVNKKTSFLVSNDKGSKSSKCNKAKSLCISIISESELFEMH